MQATAKTTSVEQGEENLPDEDDEEEREVSSLSVSLYFSAFRHAPHLY